MTTINHECYVDLEVAKLLKEAGFDWPTRYSYDLYLYSTEGEKRVIDGFASTFCNEHNGLASMPTLDVAQRWLREKNLLLYICPLHSDGKWLWRYWFVIYINKEDITQIYSVENYNTYEEALEAGIQKCLEILLEEKK